MDASFQQLENMGNPSIVELDQAETGGMERGHFGLRNQSVDHAAASSLRSIGHQDLLDQNPSALRNKDSPRKVQPLGGLVGEKSTGKGKN